jgi:PEP-CTERM motif
MLLLASPAARANTLLQGYTVPANWQAAVTQLGTDTFETAPNVGNSTIYSNATGYSDGLGIDFVGAFNPSGNYLEVVNSSLSAYFNYQSGASLDSGLSSAVVQPYIIANLPANITAIGLDVMTYGNNVPVTLTISDGTSVVVNTALLQQSFYGFTFAAPVSWLKISVPGSPNSTSVLMDNFTIGTADVAAPEPATLLLIGFGLVLLACLKKRRAA